MVYRGYGDWAGSGEGEMWGLRRGGAVDLGGFLKSGLVRVAYYLPGWDKQVFKTLGDQELWEYHGH